MNKSVLLRGTASSFTRVFNNSSSSVIPKNTEAARGGMAGRFHNRQSDSSIHRVYRDPRATPMSQ